MHLSPSLSQQAYDRQQAREKHCARWLKSLKPAVAKPLAYTTLAGILQGVLLIAQAALLALLFQQLLLENRDWQSLLPLVYALLAIFAGRSLALYAAQHFGFQAAAHIKQQLRERLLNHFAALGPGYLKQQHSGALAQASLEQVEALEPYFSRYLPQQTIAAAVPLLMIAVMLPVNWIVGLIFLVTGPLVPVFMALIGMGAASASRQQFLEMARMSGYFLDRLQGLTTLKLLGREQAELAAIAQTSDTFREKTMRVLRIAFLSSAVLEFFSAVAVALVAVYVGLSLLGLLHFPADSKIDLQTALFALLLAPEFFAPLKQLAVYYHDRAQALAAADALLHIFEQPIAESPSAKSQPSTYCLELQSVDKAYQQRPILVGIDWQIRAGETWLITGDSGAGKTTLLSLLLGFDAADSGEIRLNGERLNRENAAQTIAWMGQQSTLFYGTIADNIRLFDEAISDEEIIAAAQIAAVANFSDTLPDGLQTLIGENGYGLSGGQIQRIALARALLKNAPIIILDEPTAHLDAQIKTVVLDNVLLWGAGKTLIIASHDPELIERIPRRIHIQNGRLKCAI